MNDLFAPRQSAEQIFNDGFDRHSVDDREEDPAESGIADADGLREQGWSPGVRTI